MSIQYPAVAWSEGSNIYEVNIRQYTPKGNFAAFQRHLPRLRDMGVEILWLMPITPISSTRRQGTLGSYYACSSYTEINPEFGTKDDFRNLLNEAHRLGFKVIIDWVANHTGWQHEWMIHKDWYLHDNADDFTEVNGWGDVIDLNYDNEEMQAAMIDAMRYWVGEFDIDGFRCDMAHLIRLDFWHKARKACDEIKPLFWLGECDDDRYSDVFDATYAWRWMHATENLAKDIDQWQAVKNTMHAYLLLPAGARKMYFTSDHDENCWNGTEYEKYGMPLAKNLAVLSCMIPGIPLVYSGQELPNYKRLKFFDKDEIDWQQQAQSQLAAFYQALFALRRQHKVFHSQATFRWITDNDQPPFIGFFMVNDNDKAIVIFNFSHTEKIKINFAHEQLKGVYYNPFAGGIPITFSENEDFEVLQNDFLVYVSK